jgi:hypothetical protein
MKIKEIAKDLVLDLSSDGLSIQSKDSTIISGFTDIGILANGLLPIVNYKEKSLTYLDTETLEIFSVKDVDWISGLHFAGTAISYFNLNFRTDPKLSVDGGQSFSIKGAYDGSLDDVDGVSVQSEVNRVFDEEGQKFNEVVVSKITIPNTSMMELLKAIKYYRIVGKGTLASSLNIAAANFKSDDGGIYHPKQFVLSGNKKYGVMDIRTQKLLVPCEFNEINVMLKSAFTEKGIVSFT